MALSSKKRLAVKPEHHFSWVHLQLEHVVGHPRWQSLPEVTALKTPHGAGTLPASH